MQTYCPDKPLQPNPEFETARARALEDLAGAEIDEPITDIIESLNRLPFCYTLQCCFGHFVAPEQPDDHNLALVAESGPSTHFLYRIAYVAFCVDASPDGKRLLNMLRDIPSRVDRDNVQFGCAQWFRDRCVNSYVLQIQPSGRADVDSLTVTRREALRIQSARNRFWDTMREMLTGCKRECP